MYVILGKSLNLSELKKYMSLLNNQTLKKKKKTLFPKVVQYKFTAQPVKYSCQNIASKQTLSTNY